MMSNALPTSAQIQRINAAKSTLVALLLKRTGQDAERCVFIDNGRLYRLTLERITEVEDADIAPDTGPPSA